MTMLEDGHLDGDLRPRDRLGRVAPRRLNALIFMRAIPGFASQFIDVPQQFFDGDEQAVIVVCPCGTLTTCPLGGLSRCEGCVRVYLYVGGRLVVGNSPVRKEVSVTP